MFAAGDAAQGSLAQKDAYGQDRWRSSQAVMQECVEGFGFTYVRPPRPDLGYRSTRQTGVAGSDELHPVSETGWGVAEEWVALHPPELPAPPAADAIATYADAVARCTSRPPFLPTWWWGPAAAAPVQRVLAAAVREATALPAVRAAWARYPGCMAEHGYPDVSTHAELHLAIQHELSWLMPSGGTAPSPELERAQEYEAAAARADAACRTTTYRLAIVEVAERVRPWLEKHPDLVAEARAGWDRNGTSP